MFAELQRRQRGERMRVFGATDHNRIEVLLLVVQFAVFDELARLGMFGRGGGERPLVHVAERDDVFAAHIGEVAPAAPATADDGDAQFFIGRGRAKERGKSHDGQGRGDRRIPEKAAAGIGRV